MLYLYLHVGGKGFFAEKKELSSEESTTSEEDDETTSKEEYEKQEQRQLKRKYDELSQKFDELSRRMDKDLLEGKAYKKLKKDATITTTSAHPLPKKDATTTRVTRTTTSVHPPPKKDATTTITKPVSAPRQSSRTGCCKQCKRKLTSTQANEKQSHPFCTKRCRDQWLTGGNKKLQL